MNIDEGENGNCENRSSELGEVGKEVGKIIRQKDFENAADKFDVASQELQESQLDFLGEIIKQVEIVARELETLSRIFKGE